MIKFVSKNILPVLIFFAVSAQAGESFEFYTGVRQLGMGGVGIATVNDETALILNPAALGKIRGPILTIIDPEFEGNSILPQAYAKLTELLTPQGILDTLRTYPDEYFHYKGQMFPSFVTTNFGIGFLGKYETNAKVDSSTNLLQLDHVNDYALILGFNLRFFDGRVKVGFNGKLIDRSEVHNSYATTSTGLTWKNIISEGAGVGSDVGVILTGPWEYLPSVAAVLRDAGGTSFDTFAGQLQGVTRKPAAQASSLDLGASLTPMLSNFSRIQFGVEYRGVLTAGDEPDSMKRVHLGAELNLSDSFFIRAGMNQRYWTAGVELAMPVVQIQFATYGEEIGTSTKNKEDRRYVGKISLRF